MGHHLVTEFITEDFRASVQEVFDKALQGFEDSNFAFPLITKDGRRLEILLNATTRRDEEGHIIGVVGIGQDITARIAQEQEYSKLIDEFKWNDLVYKSNYSFKPIQGKTYHLYQKDDEKKITKKMLLHLI